jgi:hypothetical protein
VLYKPFKLPCVHSRLPSHWHAQFAVSKPYSATKREFLPSLVGQISRGVRDIRSAATGNAGGKKRCAEKLISRAISNRLRPASPIRIKIVLYENRKSCFIGAIPPRQEGRSAIVTRREAGCDGRFAAARRAAGEADGEIVWSRSPDAGIKRLQ